MRSRGRFRHSARVSAPAAPDRPQLVAYVAPFAVFMLGLALSQGIAALGKNSDQLWLREPMYWVYPLQALACAAALLICWRRYDFGPQRHLPLAFGVGVLVFALWTCPQWLLGQPPRTDGFNPETFAASPALYALTVAARFFRLVVVVPLVEEIFWRGFLQRYLISERFHDVPFGKYTAVSFWAVAAGFMVVHTTADMPAAFLTGAIYGWVAVHTRSLLACVIAHATTNLLLGGYIMATRQWGFW